MRSPYVTSIVYTFKLPSGRQNAFRKAVGRTIIKESCHFLECVAVDGKTVFLVELAEPGIITKKI